MDGENFRYSLRDLFPNQFEYLPKEVEWLKLFQSVVSDSNELFRIYWYVVDILDIRPYKFPDLGMETERLEELLEISPNFEADLDALQTTEEKMSFMIGKVEEMEARRKIIRNRFQGWKRVQDGISNKINYLEFRRSGSINFDLFEDKFEKEKGVDVNLAVDMLSLCSSYDQAIIFSGDQDYIPAICKCKDRGKHVFSVNFKTKTGKLLPGSAYRLRTVCDEIITIKHEDIIQFITEF